MLQTVILHGVLWPFLKSVSVFRQYFSNSYSEVRSHYVLKKMVLIKCFALI
jgi:hypothetical protein